MNYNAYELLGLTSSATREEVEEKYQLLRRQYQNERFRLGEEGEQAAEKLQQVEIAYKDILLDLDAREATECFGDMFGKAEQLIRENKLDEAQEILDNCDVRDAEWHYVQSNIYYRRSWYLESKKQLEFALQLEPNNPRYKNSLDSLNKILSSNAISPDKLRTSSRPAGGPTIGAGNGTCTGSACGDCLACNLCLNCAECICRLGL